MCSRSKLLLCSGIRCNGLGTDGRSVQVTWGPCRGHWGWWRQQCGTGAAARCAADPSFLSWHLLQSWAMDLWSPGAMPSWGPAYVGGDSNAVQEQLRDVQQIQASVGAFAAILGDGSVVTWGAMPTMVATAVRYRISCEMCSRSKLLLWRLLQSWSDGSVVTWGDARSGGDSTAVQGQLRDVQQIQASDGAFAAIRSDGSVVTWGNAAFGGDSSTVLEQLRDAHQIQTVNSDCAAILRDESSSPDDSTTVQDQLHDV